MQVAPEMRRDDCHVGAPLPDAALADARLGAMVDDDRQFRMPIEHARKPRQMPRQHQRIEDQAMRDHCVERRANRRTDQPVVVGFVLHHRPQADEGPIDGKRADPVRCVGRVERRPADDACDERRRRGKLEQPPRFGNGRRSLHENRGVDGVACENGRKIGGPEIAVDRAELGREPSVVAASDPPEVLVRVDRPRAARTACRMHSAPRCSGFGLLSHGVHTNVSGSRRQPPVRNEAEEETQ